VSKPSAHPSSKTARAAKVAWTSSQIEAAKDALKILRRLGSATSIGVTQSDYQDRIIDGASDVGEDLRLIPNSAIKTNIATSITAYQDAAVFWTSVKKDKYVKSVNDDCAQIFPKYQITPFVARPIPDRFNHESPDDMQADIWASITITDDQVTPILTTIWTAGSKAEDEADNLLTAQLK